MSYSRQFSPEFFNDSDQAQEWYERQRRGLGDQFGECLEETLRSVAAAPESFALVDRTTRVAMIRPFSYGVYFRIEGEYVAFLSVVHLHRKPGIWRRRRR